MLTEAIARIRAEQMVDLHDMVGIAFGGGKEGREYVSNLRTIGHGKPKQQRAKRRVTLDKDGSARETPWTHAFFGDLMAS